MEVVAHNGARPHSLASRCSDGRVNRRRECAGDINGRVLLHARHRSANGGRTCRSSLRSWRELGSRLEQAFAFRTVWSTVAFAAPSFVGAVNGEVLVSFYVDGRAFLVVRLGIEPGGGLARMKVSELPADIRVIAIGRH
jgi:hypothetical protein